MSMPEKLAQTQAAMHALAGVEAFDCPLEENHHGNTLRPAVDKARTAGVQIVFRKRRVAAPVAPELVAAN
jgi:hypothetical protein